MKRKLLLCFFIFFALAVPVDATESGERDLAECARVLASLAHTIDDAGVSDRSTFPVPGTPYLRSTRFLEEMRYFVSSREEYNAWLDLLYQKGLETLGQEIANLPPGTLNDDPTTLSTEIRKCGARLLAMAKKGQRPANLLAPSSRITPEYRRYRKVLGLYPLMVPPIGTAIAFYQTRIKQRYRIPLDRLPARGRRVTYAPENIENIVSERTVPAEILAASSRNPLGIPLPSGEDLLRLIRHYAPHIIQDETGSYDRPGMIHWEGPRAVVDPSKAVVYYYVTHAILQGRPLLQLNYVLWYTRSPRTGLFDIEAGRIHGMTIRLTLSSRGEPVMIDVIHNCGCYHFFFPSPKVFAETKTDPFREDAFVPQWLPTQEAGKRLALRVETKRHRVERVFYREEGAPSSLPYRLAPYEELESLERADGSHESIFTPEGIVKGETERVERFLLFSVGILEIGSMRQRGHHATALLGERIFDDPRLFEKYFLLH